MSKDWFGVHKYWGWYPKTWHGFGLVALMIVALSWVVVAADFNAHSTTDLFLNIFPTASLVVSITIFIVSLKGAKPEFGKKEEVNFSPDSPRAYLLLPFLIIPFFIVYFAFGEKVGAAILAIEFFVLLGVYANLSKEK